MSVVESPQSRIGRVYHAVSRESPASRSTGRGVVETGEQVRAGTQSLYPRHIIHHRSRFLNSKCMTLDPDGNPRGAGQVENI
jgi:hypothetical protein